MEWSIIYQRYALFYSLWHCDHPSWSAVMGGGDFQLQAIDYLLMLWQQNGMIHYLSEVCSFLLTVTLWPSELKCCDGGEGLSVASYCRGLGAGCPGILRFNLDGGVQGHNRKMFLREQNHFSCFFPSVKCFFPLFQKKKRSCYFYFVNLKVNLELEKTNQLGESSPNFIFVAMTLDPIVI